MIFVNPYTDFGFKKLFGEEASKELLRDFLNQLLPPHHQIVTLALKPSHRLGEILERRQAVFDLACEAASGERFVVEMQKAKQNFFKDRTVFYATFPIREQARRGEWDYRLDAVYCVGILDFVFDDEDHRQDVLTTVRLKDQHGEVFYDKLTYLYLQMPNFRKTELELEHRLCPEARKVHRMNFLDDNAGHFRGNFFRFAGDPHHPTPANGVADPSESAA